ncbi:glycosyltransferase family 50 protein [Artomyces pyxidatus]|uniref:Glycosyltransferase family 50 protein n=1 Tax=Artomyces pyxidatus TaxID=48021 RepID=A0ACB8T2R6_9AGAM|nr:glycosyltransferase family 50 protein [Artomyces pyxidatus]
MDQNRILRAFPSFRTVLVLSTGLRIALILYSEWHDARSVVKYTDVDYRVFSDATRFVLYPGPGNHAQGPLAKWINVGDPYMRETYRYTPLLALLLAPNEWVHPSFGKYLFAGCDILAGILIHKLLVSVILPRAVPPLRARADHASSVTSRQISTPAALQDSDAPEKRKITQPDPMAEETGQRATVLAALHLLSPFVFSISTRGSSESVLTLFVLLTLFCALRGRWTAAAVLLGLSTHWKIYPVIYGLSCVGVIGSEQQRHREKPPQQDRLAATRRYLKIFVNADTIRFAGISAGTFFALGAVVYAVWGYPFLYETYLYHLHRLDHRHNFSPYFYLIYLTYPGVGTPGAHLPLWRTLIRSSLASFLPQMGLALGAGVFFARRREDLIFAWFVQTAAFVIFNKVCTSQYFLWYLLFMPLLIPQLAISWRRALVYVGCWMGTQALWLSQAYRLEFLGEAVFYRLWICGLVYVAGHSWVLGGIMKGYDRTSRTST